MYPSSRSGISLPVIAARLAGEQGNTLIEVIVTTLLIVLTASATATALIGATFAASRQRHRAQAAQLAEQDQQRLRGFSAEQLNNLSQSRVVTLDGTTFTITSAAAFLSSSGTSSCGAPGAGAAAYYRIVSTINWTPNTEGAVVVESVITPPAGGILLAQVVDQSGAGLRGATVTASGPSHASGITDTGGCTGLADLEPGSYIATFSDLGYVDPTGNPAPTSAATVTATGTSRPSSNPVTMGLAGTIGAVFTAAGVSGTLTGQQATALAWFGNGTSSRMSAYQTYPSTCASSPSSCTTAAATLPASPGTVSLFPFLFTGPSYTGNYQAWAGPCEQMEPPAAIDKFSVTPGSTQTVTVQEPALNLVVQARGTRVAPGSVSLTFQSTTGTSCTASWHPQLASDAATNVNGVLASPGVPFASTATSGSTASASGYTGSYTICASASVLGTNRKLTVSGATTTNFSSPTAVTINVLSTSPSGSC